MSIQLGSGSPSRRLRFQFTAVLMTFGVLYFFYRSSIIGYVPSSTPWSRLDQKLLASDDLRCRTLPGADDTVIVMKTGSTEIEAKLPAHLGTTLRCFPHKLLFSDHGEDFQGREVLDALESVSRDIKDEHPDFELYRRLRANGRATLAPGELAGLSNSTQESWIGHIENAGWKLDKWKFLPMMQRTLAEYPDKKWYVFMEADTYILWTSLLEHLRSLDGSVPLYSGVRVFIDGVGFAHGGSGFIVSKQAMRMLVDYIDKHRSDLEAVTAAHWAGDCVLGKAFADAGVPVTDAWPFFQGDPPGMVPYAGDDGRPMPPSTERIWCNRAVSYHHMEPAMVEDLWHFEQQWNGPLTHREVFRHYVLPRMNETQNSWDNESESRIGVVASLEECRGRCDTEPDCLQFSFRRDGSCSHFALPRLGRASRGVTSGWLVDRVGGVVEGLPSCPSPGG